MIDQGWFSCELELDGKVDAETARLGIDAGAKVLAADHFSARQGVEDDHMNILCMGGRTVGPEAAWDLVQTYISSEYSQAPRHLRRLGKVAALEQAKLEEVKKSNCL